MIMVSIVVPIYGVECYIEKCVRSLFEQTFKNIEYIFVNDCTKDKSISILDKVIQEYPERHSFISILNHEVNKGLAAARKTGIKHAHGKYLLHVDSDDWLEKDAVELLYNKAEQEDADIVVFDLLHIYGNKVITECNSIGIDKVDYIKSILERKTSVNLVSKLFKTELCKKTDVLPIEGLNYSEDFAVLPRIAYYADNIVKLDKPLYNYNHLNERSYTNSVKRSDIDSLVQTLRVHKDFFSLKTDYNLYEKALYISRVINENVMLCICEDEDIPYVMGMINYSGLSIWIQLPFKHKILHICGKFRLINSMRLYKYLRNKKY